MTSIGGNFMANSVWLDYTKFDNLNENGKATDTWFGFRIFDDYNSDYDNTFKTFEALREAINVENVFRYIQENYEYYVDSIRESGGLYFNDRFLDCSLIKHQIE